MIRSDNGLERSFEYIHPFGSICMYIQIRDVVLYILPCFHSLSHTHSIFRPSVRPSFLSSHSKFFSVVNTQNGLMGCPNLFSFPLNFKLISIPMPFAVCDHVLLHKIVTQFACKFNFTIEVKAQQKHTHTIPMQYT